jgi:gluconokinase
MESPSSGLDLPKTRVIVIMGASGCGKTTVGRRLAAEIGWPFYDGDDYQPKGNVSKMSQGMALTDQDRLPWLRALHDLLAGMVGGLRSHGVLACSALKQGYRDILKGRLDGIAYVYLKANYALLESRLKERKGHFFKADLLASQMEILEEPEDALVLDAVLEPAALTSAIRKAFRLPDPAIASRPPGPGTGGNP